MSNVKAKVWTFLVYKDSCKYNLRDYFTQRGTTCCISPLHDRDIAKDNSFKKPHYHVIVSYKSAKSYSNVLLMVNDLGGNTCKVVDNISALTQYLTHKNNTEKAQYDVNDIIYLNGYAFKDYYYRSVDSSNAITDIILFIHEHNYTNFAYFVNYCINNNDEWWNIIRESRNARQLILDYIRSNVYESRKHIDFEKNNILNSILDEQKKITESLKNE